MEKLAANVRLVLKALSPAEWDGLWNEAKSRGKRRAKRTFSKYSSTAPYSGTTVGIALDRRRRLYVDQQQKIVVSLGGRGACRVASAGAFAQDRYDPSGYDQDRYEP